MALFDLPNRNTKENDAKIAKKSAKTIKPQTTIRGGNDLLSRIEAIKAMVDRSLGQYRDEYIVINQEDVLHDYITECIGNGYIAIDTETDGLDPLQNKLAGICPYTIGQKGAYIPLNHISYITSERSKGQLDMSFVMSEFQRLLAKKPEIDMFNAPFDIRFLRANGLMDVYCTWDGYLGARLMNENEPENTLKILHNKYCLGGKGDAFKFDDLFKGIPFTMIPYNVGYLYAAHDPVITYEYNEFQRKHIYYEADKPFSARNGMNGVSWTFFNIEMPLVPVIANMEDNGITLDLDYVSKLSIRYNAQLKEKEQAFYDACDQYKDEINKYRRGYTDVTMRDEGTYYRYSQTGNKVLESNANKLDDPINMSSPTQLAILLYDILKIDPPDKKNPRGTGEEILSKIDNPVAKAVLEYRTFSKLISTYIDKMPECMNPNDGRVHCKFNQYGADCITSDSLLLTNKGYVQILDLFGKDDSCEKFLEDDTIVVNKNFEFEQASHRIMFKDTDTIKITVRGGYSVEGTPNHPIMVSDVTLSDISKNRSRKQFSLLKDTLHFKNLHDLQVGDIVAIPYGYDIFPKEYIKLDCKLTSVKTYKFQHCTMPEFCNEDFAELLGMYHADGVYKLDGGRFTIIIANDDIDVQNRVKYLVKKLFNLSVSVYKNSKCNTSSICFGSIQISELKKYLTNGARNKKIPRIIMQSPKSVVCAYIRGLTLDSSFDRRRNRLFISCVDNVSFNFLQDSLANMGIITQVRHGQYEKGYDHSGKHVGVMSTRRLGVSGEMYDRFLSMVGVIQSSKKNKPLKTTKRLLTVDNIYFAYINKIEHLKNDVYDLHVPETHSFIANSMINHNTGRMSSSSPNLQNIPSKNHDIRKMFVASNGESLVTEVDNSFIVDRWCEVNTPNGWKFADSVLVGDELLVTDDKEETIIVSKIDILVDKNQIVYYY